MSGLVGMVSEQIHHDCLAEQCSKDGCSVSLQGVASARVVVDLDCEELEFAARQKRCDYLVVGEDDDDAWVVAMELKSGRFKATDTARQLQGGADMVDSWLPWKSSFRFVPVLAHGRTVPREEQKALRRLSNCVSLRGQVRQIELIRCGTALAVPCETVKAEETKE